MAETAPGVSSSFDIKRAGLIAVVVIAVILLAVFILGDDDDDNGDSVSDPKAASAEELSKAADDRDVPIYWAGPRPNRLYELTTSEEGNAYVRYLPPGTPIGDQRPAYTTVATYALPNGYARVVAASKLRGARTKKLPGGGLAVFGRGQPTSAYLAYPQGQYQVEVFDPRPGAAERLVRSGAIQPVP